MVRGSSQPPSGLASKYLATRVSAAMVFSPPTDRGPCPAAGRASGFRAPAVASTGLAALARSGSSSRSSVTRSAGSSGAFRPASVQTSAASTPAPPVFDPQPTLIPAGRCWECSRAAVSRSSPMVRVAMTPAWVNSACGVIVGVAAAAVCEAAARPASERPASTVRTGVRRATRRAVREKARGLPNGPPRWSGRTPLRRVGPRPLRRTGVKDGAVTSARPLPRGSGAISHAMVRLWPTRRGCR